MQTIVKLLILYPILSIAKYNYYMLAMQKWCGSVWQIHGLWPQYNSSSWPENCIAPAYSEITNTTLLQNMNNYWSNCGNPQSSLWEHEYTKHLSCIVEQYPLLDEDETYEMAINAFAKTNTTALCNASTTDCEVCYTLDFVQIDC